MAGFKIIRDDRNKGATALPTSGIAVTSGDLIELVHGATTWTLCTATSLSSTRKAIAVQTITTAGTEVDAIILDGTELVEATGDNTNDVLDNGDGMVIGTGTTGAQTIANSGTTIASSESTQQFVQYGVSDTISDYTIIGWVLVGNGVLHAAS